MKLSLKILAIAIIAASTYSLIGCAAPAGYSYQNIAITFSATCSDCPAIAYNPAAPPPPSPNSVLLMASNSQGGTSFITATVTNAPGNNITWTVYPTPNLGDITTAPTCQTTSTPCQPSESTNPDGTINAASGNTIVYTVPGPPIFSGAALVQANALGIPQGDLLLTASVPSDPNNPSAVFTASQLIQIYGSGTFPGSTPYLSPHTPTTPTGLTNPVVTVARNASYQFTGGVVGTLPCTSASQCLINGTQYVTNTTDNKAVWEVCPAPFALATCIVGGNATLGTITQSGLYTAPAAIPSPLPVVLVVPETAQTITNSSNYAYVGVN
jgi:hypothetical protein